jgi:hypothetical protein
LQKIEYYLQINWNRIRHLLKCTFLQSIITLVNLCFFIFLFFILSFIVMYILYIPIKFWIHTMSYCIVNTKVIIISYVVNLRTVQCIHSYSLFTKIWCLKYVTGSKLLDYFLYHTVWIKISFLKLIIKNNS